jgi:hypothetical protein
MPYAMQRLNVGLASESVAYIAPRDGDGFFLFEPRLAGNKSGLGYTDNQLDAMTTQAGATNADVKGSSGVTFIVDDPWLAVTRTVDSGVMGRKVASGQTLQVLFSLIQDPIVGADALPSRYVVPVFGGPAPVPPLRRVDYAGIVLAGLQMPAQVYEEEAMKQGLYVSAPERTASLLARLTEAIIKRLER